MPSPLIDTRSYQDIVTETEALATTYSGWKPRTDGRSDAGQALIRIFGRFAELVVERLNRAPEKHELAFLNLIGTQMLPPQPARVPLTFSLADNSSIDPVVPAGTRVAAPPLEGEVDEVLFETERDLVVTRTQLQTVYVGDPETDSYSDRTRQANGEIDMAWAAFSGDQPMPHQLFLACDQLLTQPGAKRVTLTLKSPDTVQWSWPISWAYWDGAAWRPAVSAATVSGGAWRVTLDQLPPLPKYTINGIEAGWLRAQLDLLLSPGVSGLAPESVAIGNRQPQKVDLPLAPFGESSPAKWFYLSADDVLASERALARFQVALARSGTAGASAVQLKWTYRVGSEWRPLGQSSSSAPQVDAGDFEFRDGTQAFTRDGEISFHVPTTWPREFFRSRIGRWLRVEIADNGGTYATLPLIKSLTASYGWELPRVSGITAQLNQAPELLPPPAAAFNSSPLDLSKDFYPFGEQPRFNDTLYLAYPATLAWPRAQIKLTITLTNPPGTSSPPAVLTSGNPQIAWEVWDGQAWRAATKDNDYRFTDNGDITITLPDTLAPAMVNGDEQYWLRARLVGGNYGEPGTYTQNSDKTYVYNQPTFKPPLIKTLTWQLTSSQQADVALSACLSYNSFAYHDHGVAAADTFTPFRPDVESDPGLYLGFDRPFAPRPTTLYLQVEPPLPEEVAADQLAELDPTTLAQVIWEYASPGGWRTLGALDETQMFASRGLVSFIGPRDFAERACFGRAGYWLRARWWRGYFRVPPRLHRVLLNTTWATQSTSIANEFLGSSNGNPNQTFATAQVPVLPGERLVVRERELPAAAERAALTALEGADAIVIIQDATGHPDEIWVRWQAVPDFYQSGPHDRHYTLDPLTGEVRFGDGKRGMIPPRGQNSLRVSYRTGGGEQGNRAAATIVQLKSGVPYIDGVTNHEPAQGGAPQESIDRLKERGPRSLRHGDRAITAQDLEDLAYETSPDVARAAAITPTFDPFDLWLDPQAAAPLQTDRDKYDQVNAGRMGVIVVPNAATAQPTPSLGLLQEIHAHLQARCPPTADLWVAGPTWIRVTVTATVVPISIDFADAVGARVRAVLERFLHPLTGGLAGQGWAFGRKPHRSDLFAVVEAVDGVDHVVSLEVELVPESSDLADRLSTALSQPLSSIKSEPIAPDLRRWLDGALVYSGQHTITLALAS